jgi:hypothetical protein
MRWVGVTRLVGNALQPLNAIVACDVNLLDALHQLPDKHLLECRLRYHFSQALLQKEVIKIRPFVKVHSVFLA